MTRLTFGVASSPFLATQVLRQMAKDYQDSHPKAAKIIMSAFYVDDCLTGANTVMEATEIREELNSLLAEGKMTLRKWRSSSQDILDAIPESLKETEKTEDHQTFVEHHKALGVHWDTVEDVLHVATPSSAAPAHPTKRDIPSEVARTFNHLGWYSPCIVVVKIVMQKLWQEKLAWDDVVPEDLS